MSKDLGTLRQVLNQLTTDLEIAYKLLQVESEKRELNRLTSWHEGYAAGYEAGCSDSEYYGYSSKLKDKLEGGKETT